MAKKASSLFEGHRNYSNKSESFSLTYPDSAPHPNPLPQILGERDVRREIDPRLGFASLAGIRIDYNL
jgi:hypothetical protein